MAVHNARRGASYFTISGGDGSPLMADLPALIPAIRSERAEELAGIGRMLRDSIRNISRGSGAGGHVLQSAPSPRSPLRIRMASSSVDTKILPSPIFPVFAACRMVLMTCAVLRFGQSQFEFYLWQKVHGVLSPAIRLRVALLPTVSPYFRYRDSFDSNFPQGLFHGLKPRRLNDCFNFLHAFPLSVESSLLLEGAPAPGNRQASWQR